jgi:glycosyltransferase involved in cell wall biosynthesis
MRAALDIPPHAPLFGTVARLTQQKGLPYLLEAMCRVRIALQDARLVVVGMGDRMLELQARISELGLDDCVRLLGSRTDVADIVASLDVFVLPSLWEGLPTVILEAMALGMPVVATDIPGTRELVFDGRTGLLAPPRDPAKLADAMVRQYWDRERAQAMASAARRHAALFSIQSAAKQ